MVTGGYLHSLKLISVQVAHCLSPACLAPHLALALVDISASDCVAALALQLLPSRNDVTAQDRVMTYFLWATQQACICVRRLLDNMHQLPVNMMEYTAEYASQMFSRLTAVPHATLQQVCIQPVRYGVSGRLSFHWS